MLNKNLEYWIDNVASFPAQRNGKWVDLDGTADDYDSSINYLEAKKFAKRRGNPP